MALDKLVDSAQLDAGLEDIANAIRTKGGTSAQLAFPTDFVQAIADIPSGGDTVYYTPKGVGYTANMSNPVTTGFLATNQFSDASELVTATFPNFTGQPANYTFVDCVKLQSISFPLEARPAGSNFVRFNSGKASVLQSVQFGSVGHPADSSASWSQYTFGFYGGGTKPTITVYVNASALADVPSNIKENQPWGSSGSTVIYRSSVTGEVLT